MSDFRYEWITDPDKVGPVTDLWEEIWGGGQQSGAHYVVAGISMGGSLLGVYDQEDHLVGANFNFIGEKDGQRLIYSHVSSVKSTHRDHNIGFMMRQKLKEKALADGYDCVAWTYDPMQSRNAYLAFHKLQAVSHYYTSAYYGKAMENTKLNAGLPADRMTAMWWIRKPPRVAGAKVGSEGYALGTAAKNNSREPGTFDPLLKNERIFVEIPSNLEKLMKEDLPLAVRWRMASRQALEHYFESGYQAVDFRLDKNDGNPRSFYVLERRS